MARKKKEVKNTRLLVRVLHQKGLTVREIAKEVNESKVVAEMILKDIGLKPKFERQKFESGDFILGKRVKI